MKIIMNNQAKIFLVCFVGAVVLLGGLTAWRFGSERMSQGEISQEITPDTTPPLSPENLQAVTFGASVQYPEVVSNINPAIAKDFAINTIKNISDMEKAYGFTFSADERKALSERKFVVKNLLDTSIRPDASGDNDREFLQLYRQVRGPADDYKARGPENALFFSSDVFLNAYSNLYTELLKEMENDTFFPAVRSLSRTFYEAAKQKLAGARTDAEKTKWMDVRNYFAVSHAIFSNAAGPLTVEDYYRDGLITDPDQVMEDYAERDTQIDTYETAAAFVRNLKLDAPSEAAVLEDLRTVYEAKNIGIPQVFADAYASYAQGDFKVDFTQFTPRGTYTSSSLRRQYFRGMKWYIMLPFFLKSPRLTTDAFAIAQLMAEHPNDLQNYSKIEAAINFLVGTSDDLMPVDYLQALAAAKDAPDGAEAAMDYLVKARQPKIKDLSAYYSAVGVEQSDEVLLATKGMRFFSGKFIIDSYWTGYLTQGDEAPRPGYTQKLPPMASVLEVMTLLGSDYAKSQIPKLDFYKSTTSQAIDKALGELKAQNAQLTDADWRQNIYTIWLWTIQSLFAWQNQHASVLPRFMQSSAWEAKTLMTASAFWTELRHATILYAKQSFAELGAGSRDSCDLRKIPPPPKAYIEPQLETYNRLLYLAKRTEQGLKDQEYELNNMGSLGNFIFLMTTVQTYVEKELVNATLNEYVVSNQRPDPNDPKKKCTEYSIDGISDWETLRVDMVNYLEGALPWPAEGPILSAKDRRVAIIADVHTGQDSQNPLRILYEGTGVPYVIFTAVSDANGPRLTVGFISSQYEFTKLHGGQRLTDEDWQKNFYSGDDSYNAYDYTDNATWPKENLWYDILFNLR